MFDQLSERLQSTLSDVRSRGKLSESDVDSAMREIRLALLEADVNFKVVKAFTKTLKERCLGSDVLESLDPGQQVVKIVNEELATLMGGTGSELAMASSGPPGPAMIATPKGSGLAAVGVASGTVVEVSAERSTILAASELPASAMTAVRPSGSLGPGVSSVLSCTSAPSWIR